MIKHPVNNIEVWGGIECTINRVNDDYFDQLQYSGHYNREQDIENIAALGIKKLRYPVLWEKHQPATDTVIDWSLTTKRLERLRELGIDPIAGLVHHGSGPVYVHMAEESFVTGLAAYAKKVAEQFPWLEYYTPVNEPLTTARFCGLYGIWYPHYADSYHFLKILLNECKATVLAMQEIRKINPSAKLVQTDDLGKIHSTPLLAYQAEFENHRRWLTFDLLCGYVTAEHPLYQYLIATGITKDELQFFTDNICKPDVVGLNHYLTSERYLDERLDIYPQHTHGGNGRHTYADVEAVRVGHVCPDGPYKLIKEACDRYNLPVAVTEVHLHCTREEQMRWLKEIWQASNKLKNEGYDIKGITSWAMLGSFGWNKLLTKPNGDYEPGVFDVKTKDARSTVLGEMLKTYSKGKDFEHPVLTNSGWWKRTNRVIFCPEYHMEIDDKDTKGDERPLLIIGKTGTLGNAYARVCESRGIKYELLGRSEMDITNLLQLERVILEKKPWAIVNTAGFVRVDDAEADSYNCFLVNTYGAENMALMCEKYGVKLLTFSTDLVFSGSKSTPYTESDLKSPLNIYGESKALAEKRVLRKNPNALVIRTSAFFGPWDNYNFLKVALNTMERGDKFIVAKDVSVSPTYVPDLAHVSLDLLLDNEKGIWHLTNSGAITWAELAYIVAEQTGFNTSLVSAKPVDMLGLKARRPHYSVLNSEKGVIMPALDDAISRYFAESA